MTTEDLLGLLNGVTRTARGWTSRCPSHSDKSPSLSVREAEDGRILLHCFAGCTLEEICAAMSIRVRDLFPDAGKPSRQLRHERRQREAVRHVEAQQQKQRGVAVDLVREAERFVNSASNIDISQWSNERLHEELHRLAEAYEILHKDGVLYEPF